MTVGCRSLSTAWIAGTSLCVGGTGGHLAYSSANQTGSQWLLSSGYIFNPPRFTSHESGDYGCAENLLKDSSYFDDSKEYACEVAGLSFWDNGEQFKDHNLKVDYLTFSSEFVARSGSKAWRMFIRVDNKSKDILLTRTFSLFSKQNRKWTEQTLTSNATIIQKTGHKPENPQNSLEAAARISSNNKLLQFELYGNKWFSPNPKIISTSSQKNSSPELVAEALIQVWKKRKSAAWVWIEDKSKSNSKDTIIWSTQITKLYGNPVNPTSFLRSQWGLKLKEGEWTNVEEFCKYGNERNLNEDQKENLEVFCAKPKV